jgi:anthranilate phosphoribosyltransferase
MFAPGHHSAMKHVGPSRVELGTRTIFNLLGPLSNPASVKRMLLGVFAAEWVEPLAHVLRDLGSEHAWVVHGAGGADELTLEGPNQIAELKDGEIRTFTIGPDDVGLPASPVSALAGGDAEENAAALRALLAGEPGPYRDVVLLNAGAGLVIAGTTSDLAEGIAMAKASIDQGAAAERLSLLVQASNS